MSNYDELEREVLNSIRALDARSGEDYSALAQAVFQSIELAIMDNRTSVVNTLLPVLAKFERTAKALLATLSDNSLVFCTRKKEVFCALTDREKGKIAFFDLKEHWKADKSWAGLLNFAKKIKAKTPRAEKTLEDLFSDFIGKAEKKYSRQEIAKVLTAYLPNEGQEEVIIDD